MRIRPAESRDLPAVSRLAGALVRLHQQLDPRRYMQIEAVEEGYRWFFSRELRRKGAIILVAEEEDPAARAAGVDDAVVGYVYAGLEGKNWSDLLDEHGKVHDLYVHPSMRRRGIARVLLGDALRALRGLGARQIVLMTAVQNEEAHRLFAAVGFRRTMIEMTLEDDAMPAAPSGTLEE